MLLGSRAHIPKALSSFPEQGDPQDRRRVHRREHDPNYRQVCTGSTNHVEALRIEFDPNIVPYAELVGKSTMFLVQGRDRLHTIL